MPQGLEGTDTISIPCFLAAAASLLAVAASGGTDGGVGGAFSCVGSPNSSTKSAFQNPDAGMMALGEAGAILAEYCPFEPRVGPL